MRTNEEIVAIIEAKTEEKGLSLSELARRVGMAKSAISRYFNRTREFPLNKVSEFARVLDLKPEYILGFEEQSSIIYIYNQLTPSRQNKVYTFAEHQLEEQNNVIEVDFNNDSKSIVRGRRSAAGLTIAGDDSGAYEEVLSASMVPKGADELVEITGLSMEPLITKGSEVFLRYQPNVESGEIAIVRIENEGVTCKRVYFNNGTVTLKSENPEFEDMHFDPSQVTILGKVLI